MMDAGSAGMMVGMVLGAVVIVQAVMISALKREVRECRRKMEWRKMVDTGKKDLEVIR